MPLPRRQEISTSFNVFLLKNTVSVPLLFQNLTIVLSIIPSLWQAAICDQLRSTPSSCKTCSKRFPRSFSGTELGMPKKTLITIPPLNIIPTCHAHFQAINLYFVVLNVSCETLEVFCATAT